LNATKLLEFFDARRDRGEALVLVTVFETAGSTYSKAGAQMLVDRNGVFRGMLSGGCLEGDLAVRAGQVLDSGKPQVATYDLGQDDDELWGMGVGCDGLMRMVLQPLRAESDYEPFASIAEILRGDTPAQITLDVGIDEVDAIEMSVQPPPRLLVLGAGLDAEPVVRFAAELGWRCTVVDHRPAYIQTGDFSAAVSTHCQPAEELAKVVNLERFDAAIIMSHHLVSDRAYLAQLAGTDIGYIGLLGPKHRRERLLADLADRAGALEGRLHGPAGLDIGGRGPGPIALSIVAQVQEKLADN
jgi:xanthine/CO dehydrogenase XdhC/CoxF family maturation factor